MQRIAQSVTASTAPTATVTVIATGIAIVIEIVRIVPP